MTRQDLATIVDLITEPCLIVGADARVHAANRSASQLLGWSDGLPDSLHEIASTPLLRGSLRLWGSRARRDPTTLSLRVGDEVRRFRATGSRLELSTAPTCILVRLQPMVDVDRQHRELEREVWERPHIERRLDAQRKLLERLALACDVDENLAAIATFVQTESDAASSVLLFDDHGSLRHRATAGLPAAFAAAVEAAEVVSKWGADRGRGSERSLLVSAKIATDPAWRDLGPHAHAHALSACWAMPVPSPVGDAVGWVVNYRANVGEPSNDDRRLIRVAVHLAAMVVAQHDMERQLRTRVAELAARDARRDEFLAMLGHELRTPLAPMVATAELLRAADTSPTKRQRWLDILSRQLRVLSRLVDGLVDVARVTHGSIALRRSRVDLCEVVQEVTLPELRDPRLSLKLPAEPLWVCGDHERLQQVVDNLLHNACKYTPPDGHIGLHLERYGDRARLSVRDDGVGIAAEDLPFVFDLFAQGPRSIDRSMGGLGVGLTLVKTLVERHEGAAFARSEGVGHGSEFEVQLPLWVD